jgi:hypothetical protein
MLKLAIEVIEVLGEVTQFGADPSRGRFYARYVFGPRQFASWGRSEELAIEEVTRQVKSYLKTTGIISVKSVETQISLGDCESG